MDPVAVAYAVETDIEDWELHYCLSEDAATTFTAPIVVYDLPPLASGSTRAIDLAVGFGGGNTVNLAGLRTVSDPGNDLMEINFARATNNGAAVADWPATATLIASDTTPSYSELSLAGNPNGGNVVIGYNKTTTPDVGARILGSLDGGVTWTPATIEGPTVRNHLRLFWTAYGVLGTMCDYESYYMLRPDGGPLGPYESEVFLNRGHLLLQPAALALDPSQSNQAAFAAVMNLSAYDDAALLFNAEWRDAPGYAVVKDGSAYTIGGADFHFVTAPGVADLDGDGIKDIIAVDSLGYVRRYTVPASATISYQMQNTGACSLPVLLDLDNDGVREVMVGSTDGRILVLDPDLVPRPGFPFDLGSGSDVYLCAGADHRQLRWRDRGG